MLKKTITFTNPFTEEAQTVECWFHISKADLVRMDVEEHNQTYKAADGTEYSGMLAKLNRIVDAEDGKAMMPLFEDIIRRSYGKRDGDRFMRSDEIWAEFRGTGAFDELLFELCTQPNAAGDFVNGVMPGNLAEMAAEMANGSNVVTESPAPNRAARRAAKKKPAAKKKAGEKASSSTTLASAEDRARELEEGLASATADEPFEIAQNELGLLDPSDLQTALAAGQVKIVTPT